jgi:NAD(P)H-nitrite reductase large subunit
MEPYVIQNDGSYALTLEFASGMVGPSILETVNRIVESEGARLHLTISQKLMLLDLSEESARRATELLRSEGANFKFPKQVYQPRVCVGSRYCKLGLVDTIPFGERIYEKYSDLDIPYKIKIGVSGCRASCAHSTLADIGFIGRKSGYKIFLGGKSGIDPIVGKSLPGLYDEEKSLEILGSAIQIYCEHADTGAQFQRLSHVIENLGFEKFQAMLTDNTR